MAKKSFPPSRVPGFEFAATLSDQEEQLSTNALVQRMRVARKDKAEERYRPIYHYVNPESTLNDPNGLCHWQDRWHLFYQARPPEDVRLHWAHAISDDLIHWRDLPYALYPSPENDCYSGTTLVEKDRVVAMYHGTKIGNMVAISEDPLLLNWEKLTGHAVIPFDDTVDNTHDATKPFGIFDPCIWQKEGVYYALSAGINPTDTPGWHLAAEYLFRSTDLKNWEYLHPFVEGDRFTLLGDDGACPYFLPIGDRHILLFFSHMSGGQYLLGDYDTQRDKFVVDRHGSFNFGATFPGGVHAPSATSDGKGGVVVLFNMNPAKPTPYADNYLKEFFPGDTATNPDVDVISRSWDQIMTLPRRLTLTDRYEIAVEPAGDLESLRGEHQSVGALTLPPNEEVVLDAVEGNAIELLVSMVPGPSSMFEINVLRSANKQEFTRICFYPKRGYKYRQPNPGDHQAHRIMSTALSELVQHESVITIDSSFSSELSNAITRPPESAPVYIEPDESVELRIFIDKSVVEVFVNRRQCVSVRVYPGRADSTGVSLLSRNQESKVLSVDCWQLHSIYK